MGFACLSWNPQQSLAKLGKQILDIGVLRAKASSSFNVRLGDLHRGVYELLEQYQPDVCFLEKAFHHINLASVLKLSEARGAIIAAVMRASCSLEEVSPTLVKRLIAGHGHVSKDEVAHALRILIKTDVSLLPHDAVDALAIAVSGAIHFAHSIKSRSVAIQNSLL